MCRPPPLASAGHAWAVPVSDMRGALRALYEVTIMPVFIAVYTLMYFCHTKQLAVCNF